MFEGIITPGLEAEFRAQVKDLLVPLWVRFTGCTEVRVMFTDLADDGAPAYPMILAISYPNQAAFDVAMANPARLQLRDMIGSFLGRYFEGKVHHHTAELNSYLPAADPASIPA